MKIESSGVSLSVVIPNYNHAQYLPMALESVLSQSRPAEAVFVIDDASTDHSVEVIRSFQQRHANLHLIANPVNRGGVGNFNTLLAQLPGTHVLPLAADDYVFPGMFERAHGLLAQHPQAGLCLADYIDVFPDGRQRRYCYGLGDRPRYIAPADVPRAIRGLGLVGQGFFSVCDLRQTGGFPVELLWHTDHFICVVLAARHGLCYSPEAGGAFRKLPTSYSSVGTKGPAHRQLLGTFLEYLDRQEFVDVKAAFRQSHALAIFDEGLIADLWNHPRGRYFVTPSLITRALLRKVRRRLRHPIPDVVKSWVRRQLRRTQDTSSVAARADATEKIP